MIRKPQGYDEAPAYTGEYQQLPKGKYICEIVEVTTQQSGNGNEQFVILYDIADGEHKGFFRKMFDADRAQNPSGAKWRGVYKQNMEGKGLPWLKGIITSIERSNNFTFQWDQKDNEKTMRGKKFGGIFWRRQYEKDDGSRPVITELWRIRSVAGLEEAEVPEDSMLPEHSDPGHRPTPAEADVPAFATDNDGFMNIPDGAGDEGVPFL